MLLNLTNVREAVANKVRQQGPEPKNRTVSCRPGLSAPGVLQPHSRGCDPSCGSSPTFVTSTATESSLMSSATLSALKTRCRC
eukprot:1980160-Prymnesium_polylepis.1